MSRCFGPAIALALILPSLAHAQTPGMPPRGGPSGEDEPKPEGVAEKAPREPGQLPTTPTLPPWPGAKRKKFELIELDGYFRVRTDWFSNLHLGFHNPLTPPGSPMPRGPVATPFREPLSCLETSTAGECSDSIGTANMRVRLEPVINLSEQVSLNLQVDVLDNVVLGSTPESPAGYDRINAFSGSQVPPEVGSNYSWDSIRVKRAWGEVKVPDLGVLRFGRMPSQWGLGIFQNSGGADPYRDSYCLDCDYGDTVDRVQFGTLIPGTSLRASVAIDWASSEPVAAQTDIWAKRADGPPYDLDDTDDVREWVFTLGNFDAPESWRETLERGELALDYGIYFVYRAQDFQTRIDSIGGSMLETAIEPRHASAYIPDVYLRLGYQKLTFEAEAVLVYGFMDLPSQIDGQPVSGPPELDLLQLGAVAKLNYLLLDDDLNLGLEVGYASGDQWDLELRTEAGDLIPGITNVHDGSLLPLNLGEDSSLTQFLFDFDYHVDMILFREILGTVTNATYVKPSMSYNFTSRFILKAAGIVSFANRPVATPGNSSMYGIELDGDLGYENKDEGFFIGISYGVLFPLGALDRPANLELGFGTAAGDAGTAQTVQTRMMLKF